MRYCKNQQEHQDNFGKHQFKLRILQASIKLYQKLYNDIFYVKQYFIESH